MHDTPDRSAKQGVIAAYEFTLEFENSICRDYVTERFFDPLLAGSVPVYLGAPNIAELAPADDCYVDASRFESPRALAAHLMALARDEKAYAALLRLRERPLRTEFLQIVEQVRRPPFRRLADLLTTLRGP
jgi:hypothetical protein